MRGQSARLPWRSGRPVPLPIASVSRPISMPVQGLAACYVMATESACPSWHSGLELNPTSGFLVHGTSARLPWRSGLPEVSAGLAWPTIETRRKAAAKLENLDP